MAKKVSTEWKKIKGFERYSVSNQGQVRNDLTGRILKSYLNGKAGYEKVKLCNNNKITAMYIHKLTADAFLPNPDNLKEVNHKDEDKTNNKIDNLEWCNRKYNMNYATVKKRISDSLKAYYREKRMVQAL